MSVPVKLKPLIRVGIKRIAMMRKYLRAHDEIHAPLDTQYGMYKTEYIDAEKKCPAVMVYIIEKKTGGLAQLKMSVATKLAHQLDVTWRVTLVCDHISAQSVAFLRSRCSALQVLSCIDIILDRFNHDYVPEYTVLSPTEIQSLEASVGNKSTWPKMVAGLDPIARIMWREPGDCLKVIGASPVSGVYVSYRCVCEPP
jgi:DNA-directed RNA polymerase subunit H (RpoH/RPB5)